MLKMKLNIILALGLSLIVVLSTGCLEGGESKAETMTLGELMNDYDANMDNDTKKFTNMLKSLDEGDTVIIKDKINNMTYIDYYDYTPVEFTSLLGVPFPIEGDITDRFEIGDNVEIKLHIVNVTYTEQVEEEIWTVEQETFKEGWDWENDTFMPIPQEYVKLVENNGGKVVTMTMQELINDYEYNWDNDTKKITSWLKSLDDGDTLIISDTLNDLIYNESGDYTTIDFETMVGYTFFIEGDITDIFEEGDDVELTFAIIKIAYTQEIYYDTWLIEEETFEEIWDSGTNTFTVVPQKCIKQV